MGIIVKTIILLQVYLWKWHIDVVNLDWDDKSAFSQFGNNNKATDNVAMAKIRWEGPSEVE